MMGGVILYLVVVDEAQSVAVFKLDIFDRVLPLLLLSSCLSVRTQLQSGGDWQVICNPESHSQMLG